MSAKKSNSNVPPGKLALYEKLVATIPNLERKVATMPYTGLNGNMFSFLGKDGSLALRLPQAAREAFLVKYETTLVEAYGTVLKEYVCVPDALLKNTRELAKYFAMSVEYAKGLRPKGQKKGSTTRK
jgi:hypothetical protein